MDLVVYIIIALISSGLGALLMYFYNTLNVSRAKENAKEIMNSTKKEAETLKKEILIEARDKAYQIKQQAEEDARKKNRELRELEKNLQRKELSIERKADIVDNKTADLNRRERELQERYLQIQKKEADIQKIREKQIQQLEKIASMSRAEAESALKASLLEKAKQDINRKVKELKDAAIAEANKEARMIIVSAIQHSAADHTAETTVSVVNLPNDNMKGRIIGREGRNIRHFEALTGIELIVDDTPEAVVLSGFDPIRREIARIALENLINDGRIHPSRIEEMIDKAKRTVEDSIFQAAEDACNELGIPPFQRDLMKLIGNLHYRTSYGQNVLKHSMEVGWLTGLMAAELGLDGELAKRAGFLHDIGKAVDRNVSGTHAMIGGEIARKFQETEVVINAIESHHEEIPMNNPISALVQAADAISGSRRGARGDTLESYIHRLEKLEKIAESFQGVTKTYAIQAGRELRVIVENEIVDDAQADSLADDIAQKIQQELTYPGQIKVVVIREHRGISYAK